MANEANNFAHDPRNVAKSIFDEAKLWWGTGLFCKVAAAGLGIYFVLVHETSALAPFSLVSIAAAAELLQWRSDVLKGRAEGMKRKIEYFDAFGWPLSNMELSDSLARMTKKKRAAIEKAVRENYFASKQPQGSKRAIENLQESAWWSKDLSGFMLLFFALLMAGLLAGALITLYISASTIKDFNSLQNVNRVVTAVLASVVSLGLLRLIIGYYNFTRKSEQVEGSTATLLKTDAVEQVEALKLLHEYQIARASAPPIPDWIWKLRQDTLNELWGKYRQG